MSDSMDPMAEIRASFFIECEELLEALQDGLQAMDDGATDSETINVVFRAAHSIKGGAGAFGLDELVAFAHSYETVLDLVRADSLVPDAAVMKVFFSSADVLSDLVRASRDGLDLDTAHRDAVLAELAALAGDAGAEEEETVDFQPAMLSLDLPPLEAGAEAEGGDEPGPAPLPGPDDASGQTRYMIRFKPHADLYASGNEPLFILRSLSKMGKATISLDAADVPALTAWDEEAARLAWTVDLLSDNDRNYIEEAFEFVTDVCDLTIEEVPAEAAAPAAPPPPNPPCRPRLSRPPTRKRRPPLQDPGRRPTLRPRPRLRKRLRSRPSRRCASASTRSTG